MNQTKKGVASIIRAFEPISKWLPFIVIIVFGMQDRTDISREN